jgi:nitrite reductase/ring-hydroxylating ferredoxin subunit
MLDGGDALAAEWFPVARGEEAAKRNVLQAQLLGQEIAIWRDDTGQINAWENRCPHRGVRLSIGLNLGTELRCQYHGWRYASGSGQCIYIPAHPNQKPPGVIRTLSYGAAERYGFIWVRLAGSSDAASIPALPVSTGLTLRSIFIEAPLSKVAEMLGRDHQPAGRFIFADRKAGKSVLLLHPVTEQQTLLHGLVTDKIAPAERFAVLRTHNDRLTDFRAQVEAAIVSEPQAQP